MNKTKLKLQSKRGASIMLALLLLLVCLLAGIASLTAAAANMGRHSYMRENHQKYLSVSSAAKLIREQLNGMEIRCAYLFEATDWDVPSKDNPDGDYSVVSGVIKEIYPTRYYLDGEVPSSDSMMMNFFYGNSCLEGMLKHAIKDRISQNEIPPWNMCINAFAPNEAIVSEYDFLVECPDIDEEVIVHIAIDLDGLYFSDKEFTVTVTCDGYDYVIEMNGTIEFTVPEFVIEQVTVDVTLDEDSPETTSYEKIVKSEQKTDNIVRFTVEDIYTRKSKADADGGEDTP